MPIKTRHYGLEAFSYGDYYSAAADQRRVTTIDSQLGLLSDIIGSGRIYGWEIESVGAVANLDFKVTPGMGIIGRTVFLSYGDMNFNMLNNQTKYIFMKKKTDESGGFSGSSNIDSAVASDSTPPAAPSNLAEISALIAYNQIGFGWDANAEVDFSHYVVTKIGDAEYGVEDASTETTDISFINTGLLQNTFYTYQVIAVDLSGNESTVSEISISTAVDTRQPLAPLFLQVFIGDESAQVIWDHSPSDYVESYEVQVQLLDNGYNNVGSPTVLPLIDATSEEEFGSTSAFVESLTNNSYYSISVRSLSIGGQYSQEIFKVVKPLAQTGAGEVKDIIAEFPETSYVNIPMEADLTWSFTPDPYLPTPDQFLITFLENGVRVSETISVIPSEKRVSCDTPLTDKECYAHTVPLIPFLDPTDGVVKYEAVKEYTPYLIIVQTYVQDDEDSNDDLYSNGVFLRVNRTPSYQLLPAVSEAVIERDPIDNSIIAKWVNPSTAFFSHCRVSASIIDLNAVVDEETIIVEDFNVGKATSYAIPGSYFDIDQRYVFIITPVDIFDRDGQYLEFADQFIEDELDPRPDSPRGKDIVIGDGVLTTTWGSDFTEEIVSYKIYKAVSTFTFYEPSDFTHIASVSSDVFKFIDYDVENGNKYSYMITSVNIYGNESLNPVEDDYVEDYLLTGYPEASGNLIPPENVISTASLTDVDLTWDFTLGTFDGYEIYRSIGDKYNFQVIGHASASAVSYTDEDVLLVDAQEYYYFVKKYKNETIIFVSDSNVTPSESIILGSVRTYTAGGQQFEITDLSINLENLETPLGNIVRTRINAHKHDIDNLGNDKRIELRSNSIITDWTTTDFQIYSTDDDISGAENYLVKVFADVNEEYYTSSTGFQNLALIKQAQSGSPPILYTIDEEEGTITFDTSLYTLCEEPENPDPLNPTNICPVTPYSSEPAISIGLLGIAEVSSEVTNEQIEEINATQITSGVFSELQMPGVGHDGRIGGRILPLRLPTQSFDNFVYSLSDIYIDNSRNVMGTAVTFYDIIDVVTNVEGDLTPEEDILAATSSGIWFSSNWGNNWKEKETFPEPVHRVFQSSDRKVYAVTSYGVFLSDGIDFGSWIQMEGLTGVKSIRDITEDSTGNIYITTDLGVFRLNKDKPYIEDTWEHLSIFGVQSTEAYGIIYIPEEDKILTSNELGILESDNEGATWTFISELDVTIKVIRFLRSGNYIFALTNDKVCRKEVGVVGFIQVASLSGVELSRQIVIYSDKIYITTDDGVKVSVSDDIYTDVNIEFSALWSNINEKGVNAIITSLNLLEATLFVGREKKLYVFDDEQLWLQYEQQNAIAPTVVINGVEQKLGYYYNNKGEYHNVAFYEQVDYEDVVTISNRYDIYVADSGGWVEQKFDAKVKLWKNRLFHSESTDSITVDQNPFVLFEFPTYDDSNANEETALVYETLMQDNLDVLTGITLPEGDELTALITDTHSNYQHFISQLHRDARVITSDDSTEALVFPEINIPLVTKSPVVSITGDVEYLESSAGGLYNVSNGSFEFEQDFEKGDILEIDVVGSTITNAGDLTHREIEDALEYVNSGLPSVLSQVSQINNVKLGIFAETKWPGQRDDCSPPLQAEYVIPTDGAWYDTLNSTINYEEEISIDDVTFAVLYPTAVLYVSETGAALVGSKGGVLSIEVDTLEIEELDILDSSTETVRDIKRTGDTIYLLSDKKVYNSSDFGASWEEVDRAGLPNNLGSISFIQNNIIIGAEDGIYFRASSFSDWDKILSSDNMVSILVNPDVLFAVVDNKIYLSANGYSYVDLGVSVTGNITQVVKHISTIYISTDQGLYNDTSTFYGENPRLTQVVLEGRENEGINDLNSDQTDLMIAMADGSYFQLNTEGTVLNEFSDLNSIHKILLINEEAYLFGFNEMKVPDVDYPIRLTTGVPI